MADFDGFEFIITEEEDVMLIIYARSGNPENPEVELDSATGHIILYRNPDDVVTLENVRPEVFENLSEEHALLIVEVAPTENPLENEIKQAYEARIR